MGYSVRPNANELADDKKQHHWFVLPFVHRWASLLAMQPATFTASVVFYNPQP